MLLRPVVGVGGVSGVLNTGERGDVTLSARSLSSRTISCTTRCSSSAAGSIAYGLASAVDDSPWST